MSRRATLRLMAAVLVLAAACDGGAVPRLTTSSTTTTTTVWTPPTRGTTTTAVSLPRVEGPEPSPRVVAFYYPWYGNPEVNGEWVHWEGCPGCDPETDISSDYYPVLGSYSCYDPVTLAQHFAWLRAAGVGVIASSWWGQGTFEDLAVPALLDAAAPYGIEVAFHIEPYDGRTADRLVDDVRYLYRRYGDHPAFYRTTATSRWSPDEDQSKGLFFVWSIGSPDNISPPVDAAYWRGALDAIHGLPDGGLVIANTTQSDWVDGGHFDGLYQYATLSENPDFSWGAGLPPGAWFVPSVIPGFSAIRIGYDSSTYVGRGDGATYTQQWSAALGTGIEPEVVTITSFNEWHEGTQIEPAAAAATRDDGEPYVDYRPLPADAYLTATAKYVAEFSRRDWPEARQVRIKLSTTSDWTDLRLLSGAQWVRPDLISLTEGASYHFDGGRIHLDQPIEAALQDVRVEVVFDFSMIEIQSDGVVRLRIERGNLGSTEVEVTGYQDGEPLAPHTVTWGAVTTGTNPFTFEISGADLGA